MGAHGANLMGAQTLTTSPLLPVAKYAVSGAWYFDSECTDVISGSAAYYETNDPLVETTYGKCTPETNDFDRGGRMFSCISFNEVNIKGFQDNGLDCVGSPTVDQTFKVGECTRLMSSSGAHFVWENESCGPGDVCSTDSVYVKIESMTGCGNSTDLVPMVPRSVRSKQWRITNLDIIGDHWVLSELTFYSDGACTQSLTPYIDTKGGKWGGTIASYGNCMKSNTDVLHDGIYNGNGGCCPAKCEQATAWAGSTSHQARHSTWVGYVFKMPVSVECVEVGAVRVSSQYIELAELQMFDDCGTWVTVTQLDFLALDMVLGSGLPMTRSARVANLSLAQTSCHDGDEGISGIIAIVVGCLVGAFVCMLAFVVVTIVIKRKQTSTRAGLSHTSAGVSAPAVSVTMMPTVSMTTADTEEDLMPAIDTEAPPAYDDHYVSMTVASDNTSTSVPTTDPAPVPVVDAVTIASSSVLTTDPAPIPVVAAVAVPIQGAPVQSIKNPLQRMKDLKELLDLGVITHEEFDTKKAELIAKV